jgi:hypothetical protein
VNGKRRLAVAGITLAVASGGVVWGSAAHAATPPTMVTARTQVINRPDSGNGGTWAYDNFERTLTVTLDSPQPTEPAGTLSYTATATDHGSFSAIVGQDTPNRAVAGLKIAHSASGSMNGGITYTITAPSTDTLTGTVPATENDNFTGPAVTTANWPLEAFTSPTGVTVTEGNTWSWKYATACESWTDSAANGSGNLAADGNITGKRCVFPYVYDGRPHYVAPTRENITFKENIGTWVEFVIHGPGLINDHHGWVPAKGGGVLNTGVYSGLEAHHGYAVTYTPVTGQGSFHQIPGSHGGTAYFVS